MMLVPIDHLRQHQASAARPRPTQMQSGSSASAESELRGFAPRGGSHQAHEKYSSQYGRETMKPLRNPPRISGTAAPARRGRGELWHVPPCQCRLAFLRPRHGRSGPHLQLWRLLG